MLLGISIKNLIFTNNLVSSLLNDDSILSKNFIIKVFLFNSYVNNNKYNNI